MLFVETERVRREGSTDLGLLMMLEDADGMSSAGDHIVCADDDWLVISRTERRGQRRNESSRQHLVDQPWVRSTGGSTTTTTGQPRVLNLPLFGYKSECLSSNASS